MATSALPRPTLSVLDVMGVIVGIVIGAGIFETPSLVAANSGSPERMLLAWLVGGLMTMVGALCFAELASTYPHPGGNYHFLMRAFGANPSFLFGWARLAVIQTGSIALLGFIFGDYATQVWPLGPYSVSIYAAAAVIVLSLMNIAGILEGKWTQNLLTLLTLAGVGTIIYIGFAGDAAAPGAAAPAGGSMSLGLVFVFVMLTYGGWSEAAFVSAETRSPHAIVTALVAGIALVTLVYLMVNFALLRALGLQGMSGNSALAAEMARNHFGPVGALLISLVVSVAALGSMNGTILTGGRTNYAMGRDYPIFRWMGRWSRRDTPANALLVQAVIALALVCIGTMTRAGFKTMVEFTTPVFWVFLLLTGLALFRLRAREPETPRPFRVPGYPVTPLLFCAVCVYMLYSSLVYTGMGALLGLAVLLAGTPLLYFISRREVEAKHLRPRGNNFKSKVRLHDEQEHSPFIRQALLDGGTGCIFGGGAGWPHGNSPRDPGQAPQEDARRCVRSHSPRGGRRHAAPCGGGRE